MNVLIEAGAVDWYEASARERIAGLVDTDTFSEFLGPEQRAMSPHLLQFNLTGAFDDGLIIGRAKLHGDCVFVAAQEGRFLGGAFGEVHGAKLVGLLRTARQSHEEQRPQCVLLLLDTGGVRLQEANAGELAISETIRAIVDARLAGVSVIALIGGRSGAFGGGGIVAACCTRIVISQYGRLGVSGPEVIETNRGVEEFDSKDRALVWRITGGRTRAMTGGADFYVKTSIDEFRSGALAMASQAIPLTLQTLEAEQTRLALRLRQFGDCRDAPDMWRKAGLSKPDSVPDLSEDDYLALPPLPGSRHVAR